MKNEAIVMKTEQILEKLYDAKAMWFALLEANPDLEAMIEKKIIGFLPDFSPVQGDLQDVAKYFRNLP